MGIVRPMLLFLVLAPSMQAVHAECRTGREVTKNKMIFVSVCGGAFTRISNYKNSSDPFYEPPHEVTLTEFLIGKYEVTNEQFRRLQPEHQGAPDLPVAMVTWFEAKEFCRTIGGDLPTEAQWEYAARAGAKTRWSFGDDVTRLKEYAWYNEGLSGSPHPVGQKKASAWGLHDMHGNVREWVADWYGRFSGKSLLNPIGPDTGTMRVYRGGSFEFGVSGLDSALRGWYRPDIRDRSLGFRCAFSTSRQ